MEELIKKYWEGSISVAEKIILYKKLKSNEVFREHSMEEFGKHLDLDLVLDRDKEEHMRKILADITKGSKEPTLREQAKLLRISKIVWYFAASLAFLAGLFYSTLMPEKTNVSHKYNQIIKNTYSDRTLSYQLIDGSTIQLYPGAEVKIISSYAKISRELYLLKGGASFKVQKDNHKKFTVSSGYYSTTALGTEFEVFNQADEIRVKLKEGKVVVKSEPNAPYSIASNYLNPGEILTINPKKQSLLKINVSAGAEKTQPPIVYNKTNASPKADKDFIYEFKPRSPDGQNKHAIDKEYIKAPLNTVLADLSKIRNTSIVFNDEEIDEKLFTGKIKYSDPLETVLNIICQSNDLILTKNGEQYIITKK